MAGKAGRQFGNNADAVDFGNSRDLDERGAVAGDEARHADARALDARLFQQLQGNGIAQAIDKVARLAPTRGIVAVKIGDSAVRCIHDAHFDVGAAYIYAEVLIHEIL